MPSSWTACELRVKEARSIKTTKNKRMFVVSNWWRGKIIAKMRNIKVTINCFYFCN
ncbi:hypothetical protein BX661DRAFT_183806 [Kickxella alabastrina]|uniref:uncharacterized protein n=1 Tax=Kickxella alabastrina TaxID=61397 RepID=UPI00221FEECC|nr:uncharacterized protein BX661DRAFT_183806 [Kickxella alabastrina]KAI7826334.1 hypothetical protein BX661DRAFT_183806 [Kickxella alabastrina]